MLAKCAELMIRIESSFAIVYVMGFHLCIIFSAVPEWRHQASEWNNSI